VDSGNLAGSLLTLQAGLAELKDQPLLSANAFQGLQDTVQVLAEVLPASTAPELVKQIRSLHDSLHAAILNGLPQTLAAAVSVLDEVQHAGRELAAELSAEGAIDDEVSYWTQAFKRQFNAFRDDLGLLAPESRHFNTIPTLAELARTGAAGTETRLSAGAPVSGYQEAVKRLGLIEELMGHCGELAEMVFGFLYDSSRDLLSVGFDVDERRRDPFNYDLLASEARRASFLLIAQGQAPQKHWFALGRLLTSHVGDVSLISWSGTMFEFRHLRHRPAPRRVQHHCT